MANDSNPSRRKVEPAHPSPTDDESWKTHPSAETDADEGHNAEVDRRRKIEENAPRGRETRRGHAVVDSPD